LRGQEPVPRPRPAQPLLLALHRPSLQGASARRAGSRGRRAAGGDRATAARDGRGPVSVAPHVNGDSGEGDLHVLHVIPSLASQTGGPAFAVVEASRSLGPLGVATEIVATDLPAAVTAGARRSVTRAELPDGAAAVDVRLFRTRPPRRFAFSP